jgi:hypothetical protein
MTQWKNTREPDDEDDSFLRSIFWNMTAAEPPRLVACLAPPPQLRQPVWFYKIPFFGPDLERYHLERGIIGLFES